MGSKTGMKMCTLDDVTTWGLLPALIAELLGTFLLVFVGCASCLNDSTNVQIALCFGLTVAALAQTLGHISGCHINPAVTTGVFISGEISIAKSVCYVVVQCIGAIAGAGLLSAVVPEETQGLGLTKLSVGVHDWQGLIIETIISAVLVFVVCAVCDANRSDVKGSAPLAIGLSISACHFAFIGYTGSSMNPARSFGPAVILNDWENHWVYWVGPLLGGLIAGILYRFLFKVRKEDPDSF